ncbi:carboxymuconolactone decarboxylase family protein [Nonomuraea roseola]|uniref:Carboxymuconolactone decarboxylase family protein n=1 Tax=Nonomuraea roseola TaxID=46179 RepID=A0ABV5PS07_9ACTN
MALLASVMHGVSAAKIEAVSAWRDSDLFSDVERLILAYAEAMTDTSPTVTDNMISGLLVHLTEPQLVELTTAIAFENQRARTFAALGLTAQGFKEHCDVRRR